MRKTVIYINVFGQCRTQYMLPIQADDHSSTCTFTTGKSVLKMDDKSSTCTFTTGKSVLKMEHP